MGLSLGGEAKGEASSAQRQWGAKVTQIRIENTVSDVPAGSVSTNSSCGPVACALRDADLIDGGDCQASSISGVTWEALA